MIRYRSERADRRELAGADLVDQNRFRQVSQVVVAKREHLLVNHLGDIARKENLATDSTVFESARPVGDRPEVVVTALQGTASMKSHTDPQSRAVTPVCGRELLLDGDGCIDRCLGILERSPKVVARPPEQEPASPIDNATDQFVVDLHALGCSDRVLLP